MDDDFSLPDAAIGHKDFEDAAQAAIDGKLREMLGKIEAVVTQYVWVIVKHRHTMSNIQSQLVAIFDSEQRSAEFVSWLHDTITTLCRKFAIELEEDVLVPGLTGNEDDEYQLDEYEGMEVPAAAAKPAPTAGRAAPTPAPSSAPAPAPAPAPALAAAPAPEPLQKRKLQSVVTVPVKRTDDAVPAASQPQKRKLSSAVGAVVSPVPTTSPKPVPVSAPSGARLLVSAVSDSVRSTNARRGEPAAAAAPPHKKLVIGPKPVHVESQQSPEQSEAPQEEVADSHRVVQVTEALPKVPLNPIVIAKRPKDPPVDRPAKRQAVAGATLFRNAMQAVSVAAPKPVPAAVLEVPAAEEPEEEQEPPAADAPVHFNITLDGASRGRGRGAPRGRARAAVFVGRGAVHAAPGGRGAAATKPLYKNLTWTADQATPGAAETPSAAPASAPASAPAPAPAAAAEAAPEEAPEPRRFFDGTEAFNHPSYDPHFVSAISLSARGRGAPTQGFRGGRGRGRGVAPFRGFVRGGRGRGRGFPLEA